MLKTDPRYISCCQILLQELLPATGCTEPIAIAYCAAVARDVLGDMPDRVHIEASGNIIKNVNSVSVPNTNGLKGIKAAAAAGIVAGRKDLELQVIADVTKEQCVQIKHFLKNIPITIALLESNDLLDIRITVYANKHSAAVRLCKTHTFIQQIVKDGCVIGGDLGTDSCISSEIHCTLTVKDIIEFADSADLDDVRDLLERQIELNTRIAREGLDRDWGANIGSTILEFHPNDIRDKACAWAAAGSDARMSGCAMPVVINCGNGNQGLTVSLPVIVYAHEYHKSHDELLRALIVSNLCALHIKDAIGKLSAFCGAVTAGSAAGAGIAWLLKHDYETVVHTIVNSLAITSGIVCDGAKASCAGKVSTAVYAGIMGFEMYLQGQQFYGGDGIITKGIENTIANIGVLGREGMRETDRKILEILTKNS